MNDNFDMNCEVCGADGAGFHYSGFVCSCCRVFFFRQTKRKKLPPCRNDGNCVMKPGAGDNCRSCRYKKCLEANMKPNVVGRQQYIKQSDAWIKKRKVLEKGKSIDRDEKSETSELQVDLQSSANQEVQTVSYPSQAVYDRWNPEIDEAFSIKHTFCRAITQYADFLTAAPEIHQMLEQDKMKLIQAKYVDCYYLGICFDFWQNGINQIDIRNTRFRLGSEQQAELANLYHKLGTFYQQLSAIFTNLKIAPEEAVILKFIALFSPPIGITENGRLLITQAKRKYCHILANFITESNPLLPMEFCIIRVRELLRVLHIVRDAAYFVRQLCISFITSNKGNLSGQLSYDLHLRQY